MRTQTYFRSSLLSTPKINLLFGWREATTGSTSAFALYIYTILKCGTRNDGKTLGHGAELVLCRKLCGCFFKIWLACEQAHQVARSHARAARSRAFSRCSPCLLQMESLLADKDMVWIMAGYFTSVPVSCNQGLNVGFSGSLGDWRGIFRHHIFNTKTKLNASSA